MLFHYTATFDDDRLKYHGEVEMPYVRKENIEKDKEYIVTECKRQFIVDCERWGSMRRRCRRLSVIISLTRKKIE